MGGTMFPMLDPGGGSMDGIPGGGNMPVGGGKGPLEGGRGIGLLPSSCLIQGLMFMGGARPGGASWGTGRKACWGM